MTLRTRAFRLILGLGVVATALVAAFTVLPGWEHYYGATQDEIARPMPGDELLPSPLILWTHGVTIEASPEAIWPWIAQLGDERGGFYSYTAIENTLAGGDVYHNADRIIPEYQHPQPGDSFIRGALNIRDARPNQWLLTESPAGDVGWTWVWGLYPTEDGKTRLVIRNRVQPMSVELPSVATLFIDLGGFVMEKRMMQGIKDRAEGRTGLPYQEQIELGLWLATFAVGMAAGVLFLIKREWGRMLLIGAAAIVVLLALIFVQPGIWIGLLLDLGLVAGLYSALRVTGPTVPALRTPRLA